MPKPRDVRRPMDLRAGRSGAPVGAPLVLAADRCIAAYEAVRDLDDPDLNRLSEMLLIAVGKRLAREDRHALRQRMN